MSLDLAARAPGSASSSSVLAARARRRALASLAILASSTMLGRASAQGPKSEPAPSSPSPSSSSPSPSAASSAPTPAPRGSASAGTGALPQFRDEIDYAPQPAGAKVSFSLEDADLPELVKVMGQLTGKRFIFGGKVRNIKATIYSPQKVTVAEAYQAFLSILETNGLTVIPHGPFLKIVETGGVVSTSTPVYAPGQAAPVEDRYVTRLHRLSYVTADEVANVLSHFKSRDGDVSVYSPGNLLILTDTGTNLKRMMSIVEQIDVVGVGDQIWIEPLHYADAQDVATKLNELFDVAKGTAPSAPRAPGAQTVDARVTKIVPEPRTNAVIVVGTEKAYARVLELIRRIDVPTSGEGEIHVLPLQHADAEELAKTLSELVSGRGAAQAAKPTGQPGQQAAVFEGSVRVTAEKSTNSLLITSSLRDYASLRNVIDRLDQARRQVYLEAVIMEVSTDHARTLGVSFHGGQSVDNGGAVVLGGSDAATSALWPSLTDTASLQGLALGVRSSDLLSIAGISSSIPAFGVVLHAVATSGDANVLSTPHIMATDNVPAEISVGENVPLQSTLVGSSALGTTGTSSLTSLTPMTSISRTDIGTKIKLVPHINDSNEVRLEIDEEISEMGAGSSLTPRIAKRNVKTQAVVQDQQTIVIGGLVRDYASSTEVKVPVLGDIPIIGALFKQTERKSQKRNLLLILTPYVIRDPADLRAIFERKMQERQEFLDRYLVFSGEAGAWEPHVDYTRTRGLVEEIRQTYLREDERAAVEARGRPAEPLGHLGTQPLGEMTPRPTAAPGAPAATPTPVPAAAPNATPPALPTTVKPIAVTRAVTMGN
jgi:general secretion pathway protein D